MKERNEKRWKDMLAGGLIVAAVAGLAVPALAATGSRNVRVDYSDIKLVINGETVTPRDGDGNVVEPFTIDGTTYLPVRAVGEAVGKTVQWEPKTNSVYLGKHTGEKPAVWLQDLDYFTGKDLRVKATEKDNLGNVRQETVDASNGFTNTYLLNGQYSAISGTLFQRYDYRSHSRESELLIYGDGELLYSAKMTGGMQPIDFYVDLEGVLELKIDFNPSTPTASYYPCSALDDVGLWT